MFEDIHDPAARVRAVCEIGCQVTVDKTISPKLYFRSGLEMLRMAIVYHEEGNIEAAFILYSKFVTLFVEKLPKHPDYKSATTTDISKNKKKVKEVFPIAEQIKNDLKQRYTVEEEKRQENEQRKREELAKQQKKLQQEVIERQKREEAIAFEYKQESEEKWFKEQEERYRELQENERRKYIEKGQEIKGKSVSGLLIDVDDITPSDAANSSDADMTVTQRTKAFTSLATDEASSSVSPPTVDRSLKPRTDHFTSIGVFSHNAHGLRDVFVPTELMKKFLNIAFTNTAANIETCGILAGKLARNAFHITHLLIPKQSGTSDTCNTHQEEDIFEYQDKYELITLGWIHTHPSQTAFLSSVDMHTQCAYQLMMPEAIAIVCSPKYDETGIFMLTPDRGLSQISKCREKGFHVHPKEPPLFETCNHVHLSEHTTVTVCDLRNT